MNILLCCAVGMSSSILVKTMRQAAKELGQDQYKIASVDIGQIARYISRVDMVLIAPQLAYEYDRISLLAKQYHIPVFVIDCDDYGNMDGKTVLLKTQKQMEELHEEEIVMDTLSSKLEKYILPFANKLGSNRILGVIRNAMAANVALLIIGSVSILLTNFPHEGVANFLAPANDFFNTIYAFTSGVMGLITSVSVAYYASIEFRTVPTTSVLTSVVAFLITQSYIEEGWPVLNIDGLGTSGLLSAMVVGIVSVKIIQIFQERNIGIKMPEGVPPAVADSFSSLIPAFVVLVLFTFLTTVLGVNINEGVAIVLSPLAKVLNTLPGYVIYHMLCALVFFCGINSAVVIGVVEAFIIQNGLANEAAHAAGKAVEHVATYSVDTMVWAGGTGATIGLVILMVFLSKSKMMKTLGRVSLGPAIFNINEPVIFGVPIAFNPILLIPFVLTPGIIAGATYLLMTSGIITMPIVGYVPWTLPPIIIGFFMSGGALSTTIWAACIVLLSIAIYYPFFRIADKQMYTKEKEEELTKNNVLE
ncbi:MAG: PTS transporter subunit EIIC [Coprobacillaceae bacterium]